MQRTGRCLCGAVSYTAEVHETITACHCGMCRRWTGGPLLSVGTHRIDWTGEPHITTFTSSGWAERGFCSTCGSCLFYRVTIEGRFQGFTSLPMGTLDDQTGMTMTKEYFSDKRPGGYHFSGDRKQITEAEVMALLASLH